MIFAAAPELCGLIAGAEAALGAHAAHPKRRPEGPQADLLPFLADQAADWEAAALAALSAPSMPASPAPGKVSLGFRIPREDPTQGGGDLGLGRACRA